MAIDNAISHKLQQLLNTSGGVSPRPTCPGIVSDLMSFNFFPIVDIKDVEDFEYYKTLLDDLLNSETWDREDWENTIQEFGDIGEKTELKSIALVKDWLVSNYSIVDSNYQQLSLLQKNINNVIHLPI